MQENCGSSIVFKPSEEDENTDYYHIVDCRNGCSVMRVKNWAKSTKYTSACYCSKQKLFLLANDAKMTMVKLENKLKPLEIGPLTEFEKKDICKYETGSKIHDVFLNAAGDILVVHELADTQVNIVSFVPT
jgi:hypothetical protein